MDKLTLAELAKILHEARMRECWSGNEGIRRQPWPEKLPGDFGYVPQTWVDVAFSQAKAVMKLLNQGEAENPYKHPVDHIE